MQQSIALFTVIKLAGALYLVYLGVQAFSQPALARRRARRAGRAEACEADADRRVRRRRRQPKLIVFFVAVLPQFADPSAGAVPLQLLTLGVVFCAIAIVCDGTWALAAGTARDWLVRSPRRLEAISGTGGVVMIGLGAGLAVSGRKE